jgi:hypothetical protein
MLVRDGVSWKRCTCRTHGEYETASKVTQSYLGTNDCLGTACGDQLLAYMLMERQSCPGKHTTTKLRTPSLRSALNDLVYHCLRMNV